MTFRAGDVVHHGPTGEDWVVAVDEENGEIAAGGWPETWAKASDCTLVEAAADTKRRDELTAVANGCGDQRRGVVAARQLAALIDAEAPMSSPPIVVTHPIDTAALVVDDGKRCDKHPAFVGPGVCPFCLLGSV